MKKIWIFLAFFLLFGISSGVVMAYLTSDEETINIVSLSDTEIGIEEEFDPPEELIPGMEITKIARIKNLSDSPCSVRVRITYSDSKAEEQCEKIEILDGWTWKEDGFYYWNSMLGPKETTGALFDKIRIRQDINAADLEPFEVQIYAEAIQDDGVTTEQKWRVITEKGEQ